MYVNIYVTGKKAHTTLEMDDNVIYLNFEYANLVSSCLFASQTWSTKVRKVDFTALNRLTRLQRRTTDSIDQLDFRQLFRLNSTPTSNDRLDRSTRSISGSTTSPRSHAAVMVRVRESATWTVRAVIKSKK